jgi:hypothetical protein
VVEERKAKFLITSRPENMSIVISRTSLCESLLATCLNAHAQLGTLEKALQMYLSDDILLKI